MVDRARDVREYKITVSDYRVMPEAPPYYQLIDGELFMTPSPSIPHQEIVAALGSRLRMFVKERKLGTVLFAPVDVYLSEVDVVQPDILFVATANQSRIERDGIHGPPDLVVEVLSPSNRTLDLKRKRARYAGFGVVEAWFVDPDSDLIYVYLLQKNAAEPARTLGRGSTLMSEQLPGFEVAVSDVIDAK